MLRRALIVGGRPVVEHSRSWSILSRLGLRAGEVARLRERPTSTGAVVRCGSEARGTVRTVYLFPSTLARRSSAGCDVLARGAWTSRSSYDLRAPIVGFRARVSRQSSGMPVNGPDCRRGADRLLLRHTAATEMLRVGGSLDEVGQVLRHGARDTTSIYAKVDRRSLVAVVQPWPGGAASTFSANTARSTSPSDVRSVTSWWERVSYLLPMSPSPRRPAHRPSRRSSPLPGRETRRGRALPISQEGCEWSGPSPATCRPSRRRLRSHRSICSLPEPPTDALPLLRHRRHRVDGRRPGTCPSAPGNHVRGAHRPALGDRSPHLGGHVP